MALIKKLYEAFNAPVHFKLTQLDGKRVLRFRIYPAVLLLVVALLLVTLSVGIVTMVASDRYFSLQQQKYASELQERYNQLGRKSAENEVKLSLQTAQIDAMKQEMQRLESENTRMRIRLTMFDDVLAARKEKGVHLLRPTAQWQEENRISYSLILVKGDNYPRWAHGSVQLSVMTPDKVEKQVPHNGKERLKFEMTTQEFIDGTLTWSESWRPEKLIITLFDDKGKQTVRKSIPILGAVAATAPDASKEKSRD